MKHFLIILFLSFCTALNGQKATWITKPSIDVKSLGNVMILQADKIIESDLFKVYSDRKVNICDQKGNIVFSDYNQMIPIDSNLLLINKDGFWTIYDAKFKIISQNKFDDIRYGSSESKTPIKEQFFLGLRDKKCTVVYYSGKKKSLKNEYRNWGILTSSILKVSNDNEKYALMDLNEQLLTGFDFLDFEVLSSNSGKDFIRATQADISKVLLNCEGKKLLNIEKEARPTYPNVSDVLFFTNPGGCFSINQEGKTYEKYEFDDIESCWERFFNSKTLGENIIVSKKGLHGVVDKNLQYKIKPQYTKIVQTNDLKRLIAYDNHFIHKLVDESGRILLDNQYTSMFTTSVNKYVFTVKEGRKFGLHDMNGNTIIPDTIDVFDDAIFQMNENLFSVPNSKEIVSIYDYKGNIIAKGNFDRVQIDFNCGAKVQKNKKWTFFAPTGKQLFDYQFDDFEYSTNKDYLIPVLNKKKGLYDLNGKEILPIQYEMIKFIGDYLWIVENGKLGILKLEKE